jgi:hypothetical protein
MSRTFSAGRNMPTTSNSDVAKIMREKLSMTPTTCVGPQCANQGSLKGTAAACAGAVLLALCCGGCLKCPTGGDTLELLVPCVVLSQDCFRCDEYGVGGELPAVSAALR